MILADKIVDLRKKMGWSQEELAEQLNVSRQSVSKWESAQSIPDMDKIVRMSEVFSVTTDYLLKDDMQAQEVPQVQTSEPGLRKVSLEEASTYMDMKKAHAKSLALYCALCVASPILLIILTGLSEYTSFKEGAGVAIGITVLLVMVAAAVAGFIRYGSRFSDYRFLDEENFETAYGVEGLVKRNKGEFRETYSLANIISTVLCILSPIPLIVVSLFYENGMAVLVCVGLMLLLVAIAVYGYVSVGTVMASYNKLLEEGDYTRENKAKEKRIAPFATVYWLLATALGLVLLFTGVELFWVVWPIAGVLYAIVRTIFLAFLKK